VGTFAKPSNSSRPFLCVFIASVLILTTSVVSQINSTPQSTGGAATGGYHAPILDANSRPITAGGTVANAALIFKDIADGAGIGRFRHRMGEPDKRYIVDVSGSGVAILDYDNDGWPDIYLVNGSTKAALDGREKPPRAALFHNNRDGRFTDVTERAGVGNERWGQGVAVGDFDNDGWPDLYVTNFGKNRLYHNNHDGTFTDIAEKAGVALDGWSTGATFGDYDGDGNVDIFVPGYVQFAWNNLPAAAGQSKSCQFRGVLVMCGPRGLQGEADHLFRNNGDGTFSDVSEKAGVADKNRYYGFGAVFVDVNDDGKLDLVVANDSTPGYLYVNRGDGTFADLSLDSGLALNEDGREQASMGIAIGDYRNDGTIGLYVTNFSDDYNTLFQNNGKGSFEDVSRFTGLLEPTIPFLGWGTWFFDYDNDGWLDLFVANGHVYPGVDKENWGTSYAQRPLLFQNLGGKRFAVVSARAGSGLGTPISGRGAAAGDLFNDGHIDVVVNNLDGKPTLLRNEVRNGNHWIEFKLVGTGKSPRDAIGASMQVVANGMTQRRDVISGGSYESTCDFRLHFGLGASDKVSFVQIRWPDGVREKLTVPAVNRILTVVEGKGFSEPSK